MAGKTGHRGWGSLRALPSGRWQASYLGPDRKRHTAPTTFRTKTEGSAWLDKERTRIDEGRWRPPTAVVPVRIDTFGAYAQSWIAGRGLAPRTVQQYRMLLRRFIDPTFGETLLRDITAPAVRVWHAGLNADAPVLRAQAYSLLRTVLNTAVSDELIEANPCRIRGAGRAVKAHKTEPASLAELEAITAAMPERYRALVQIAAWTALRFGEAAELRRTDVAGDVLRVRRGVVDLIGQGRHVGPPKSRAGIRDVTIPPHVVPLLAAHLLRWSQPGDTGLVFPGPNGRQLSARTLHDSFKRARAAAGRPDLRWHDLRHTGATMAAQSGASLAELMARLGHSSPRAAMVYQHSARGRDREIAAALSRLAGQ